MPAAGHARVVDGDTLEIGTEAIRIHGMDAPEASQVCQLPRGAWDSSSATAPALADGSSKTVHCAGREIDQNCQLF